MWFAFVATIISLSHMCSRFLNSKIPTYHCSNLALKKELSDYLFDFISTQYQKRKYHKTRILDTLGHLLSQM